VGEKIFKDSKKNPTALEADKIKAALDQKGLF